MSGNGAAETLAKQIAKFQAYISKSDLRSVATVVQQKIKDMRRKNLEMQTKDAQWKERLHKTSSTMA